MKTIQIFSVEMRRLLPSRLTWLVLLLTALSPLAGLVLYRPASASTMLSMYLANPAIAGGVAGGILFALLTVFELDRADRGRMDVLMDAVVSPLNMALVRLQVLLAAARGTDDFDQPELRVFGLEFDVAANVAAPDIYAADYMGTDLYYLIVPDAHTFWQIANLEIQFYGNNATYVENVYAFNVDADASVDEQAALRTDLLAQGSVSVTCTALDKQSMQEFYGSFFFLGIFLGGVTAAAGGIAAAIFFGYVCALIFRPRMK